MNVVRSEKFRDVSDRRYLWLVMHGEAGEAWAWECAVRRTVETLADNPERFPLCHDPTVQGRNLREAHFGAGRTKTHRLIFRVHEATVEVLTVRSFAQDDLTPADL